MGRSLVVGSLDDGDEVVGAQHGILCNYYAAEVGDFFVNFLQAVGAFVEGLAPFWVVSY